MGRRRRIERRRRLTKSGKDNVENVTLETETNAPLAYNLGLGHHQLIMSMLGEPRGMLEREVNHRRCTYLILSFGAHYNIVREFDIYVTIFLLTLALVIKLPAILLHCMGGLVLF